MAVRQIERFTETEWVLAIQHPALRLTLLAVEAARRGARLPAGPGCYVHLALPLQRAYVGTGESLRTRVPGSLSSKLPDATHVLLVEPVGVRWSDGQRFELEARLIAALPGEVNKSAGRRQPTHSLYLDSVVAEVLDMAMLLLSRASTQSPAKITQGSIARRLVLGEHKHPLTVRQLTERLRSLGWPVQGATVHRTLRRDLRDPSRGGSITVRVTGPWSAPDTLVYVAGRRYSGWRGPGA